MEQTSENLAERIGRERPVVGWPWRLFLFSMLVLAAAAVLYFGLEIGYKTYLDAQIRARDLAIADLSQTISPEEQRRFVDFYSQLANLRVLLDGHVFVSRLFPLLEANTNQLVYFDSVDLNMKDRRLALEGVAASYEALAQQLEALDRAPEIERVLVGESRRDGNFVRFRLSLFLVPILFE